MLKKFLFGPRMLALLSIVMVGSIALPAAASGQQEEAKSEQKKDDSDKYLSRYSKDLQYLASDELGGRDTATPGAEKTIRYMIQEFEKYGVKSAVPDGSFRQPFEVKLGRELVESTSVLSFKLGGEERALTFKEHYYPQQVGGSADIKGDVVFIGYGIEDKRNDFNEYDGMDVEGKVLVMMSYQPKFEDKESYYGKGTTRSSSFVRRKLRWAKQKKAAGVVFVNHYTEKNDDNLSSSESFGSYDRGVPFVRVTQSIFNEFLSHHPLKTKDGKDLGSVKAVCDHINKTGKPVSQPIEGLECQYKATFRDKKGWGYNVCGMIEGEGPLAHETIVIGAHYDHLGIGGFGSRTPNRKGEIHNGADDNATGTVAVMEIARRIAESGVKPARRIVFIGFSAEERGLIGSRHYCDNPLFPMENTVAMINFDMIGWLRAGGLTVRGIGTSNAWPACVEKARKGLDIKLSLQNSPVSGSDHMSFLNKQRSVVTFHTGSTPTYHTPDDTFETINVKGAVKCVDFAHRLVLAAAETKDFKYTNYSRRRRRAAYLGASLDFDRITKKGVTVNNVVEKSPAEKGGLRKGDILHKLGKVEIRNRDHADRFLRSNRAGNRCQSYRHSRRKRSCPRYQIGSKVVLHSFLNQQKKAGREFLTGLFFFSLCQL